MGREIQETSLVKRGGDSAVRHERTYTFEDLEREFGQGPFLVLWYFVGKNDVAPNFPKHPTLSDIKQSDVWDNGWMASPPLRSVDALKQYLQSKAEEINNGGENSSFSLANDHVGYEVKHATMKENNIDYRDFSPTPMKGVILEVNTGGKPRSRFARIRQRVLGS